MNEQVFRWIVGIFRKHKVSFVVSGGLAARIFGSSRPLRDFDFDIEKSGFKKINPDIKSYMVKPLHRNKSRALENDLVKLRYKNRDIDIASATNARIFDRAAKKWIRDETNLEKHVVKKVYGIRVPVIHPKDFIEYKRKSPRKEDLEDIKSVAAYLEGK